MKIYLATIFIVILGSLSVAAQQMPIDFDESKEQFVAFGGTAFSIVNDPVDANNLVGRIDNNGAEDFEGLFLDLQRPIDLSVEQKIKLDFLVQDNESHTMLLKLENGNEANVEVAVPVQANSRDVWNTLVFDFANARYSAGGAVVSAQGSYSRVTIFVDNGRQLAGTYLFDNLANGTSPSDTDGIDVVYEKLVWSDEFDSPNGQKQVINSANWHHQIQIPRGGNWYNGEVQHYTDRIENSYVEDGFLHINAKRERYSDQGYTKNFTSARLNSKFAFTYGRVDVRAKLPEGNGTWPAIWTLGKNINEDGGYWDKEFGRVAWPAPGEIDIMEHGLGAVNETSSALHTPCNGCSGNTKNYKSQFISNVAEDFHVYSINWSPDQITFLVDNVPFYTYNPEVKDAGTWPFTDDQYLLLNVAMGGIAGNIDPSFDQSAMVIDYVRVFQNNTLGMEENQIKSFQLFPNPAENTVIVKSESPIDKIELFTLGGQRMEIDVEDNYSFSVKDLATGMYVVKVTSGEVVSSEQLLME
jgi:beta-glucanase (GH16 family)